MIFDPKDFIKKYLKDFHKVKALYLKNMISSLPYYESIILEDKDSQSEKDSFRRILKVEMRLTYFHAIETFFELFFIFKPNGKEYFDDEFVLRKLAYSDWRKNFKEIQNIAKNDSALDFMNDVINYSGFTISAGHFLFYPGLVNPKRFPDELWKDIGESIEAIKYGIKIIATDFVRRDDYNAYKHGVRAIPVIESFIAANSTQTTDDNLVLDFIDSMSYFLKGEKEENITIVTKNLDFERDYQMTLFCSNLIHQMVFFRRLAMKLPNDLDSLHEFPVGIFDKELIMKSATLNVDAQELIFNFKTNQSI